MLYSRRTRDKESDCYDPESLSGASNREAALKECCRLICHFKSRANKSKWQFNVLRYSAVFLAVAVTVAAAMDGIPRSAVTLIGGLAALAAALLSATNPQSLWLHSRNVQQKLQSERVLFLQSAGDYAELPEETQVRRFSGQIMEIWSSGHESWARERESTVNRPISGKA